MALFLLLSFLLPSWAKNVLVTEENRGIERALVQHYLDKGWRVWTTCRTEKDRIDLLAQCTAQKERFNVLCVDLTHNDAGAILSRSLGKQPLDLVIHNAGHFPSDTNHPPLSTQDWLHAFHVNVIAPIQITLALKDTLLRSQCPHVVLISSRRGSMSYCLQDNYAHRYGYRSSKAALHAAVCALPHDLDPCLFTLVHPGWVSTRMTFFNKKAISPKQSAQYIHNVIINRKKDQPLALIDAETNRVIPW